MTKSQESVPVPKLCSQLILVLHMCLLPSPVLEGWGYLREHDLETLENFKMTLRSTSQNLVDIIHGLFMDTEAWPACRQTNLFKLR